MTDFKYPAGYVPMKEADCAEIIDGYINGQSDDWLVTGIEKLVFARLPKPETAERDALLNRINKACEEPCEMYSQHEVALYLLADIREYLTGDL